MFGRYASGPATAGPWSGTLQHGGPPSALSIRAAERAAAAVTGRSDLLAVRFSAEFIGPVPVDQVEISCDVQRVARSAVLVAAVLSSGGRACLQSRTWLVADTDTGRVAHPSSPLAPAEGLAGMDAPFPWGQSIEWRVEYGGMHQPGPARVWARPMVALVDGHDATGLQRVAVVGDAASGISSELDWDAWSFVNVDLDIHLARPMVGEWVLLDARTQLGAHGSALARSSVSDTAGELGATLQTLVLGARRR